jgi:hypothetical protein
MSTDITTIIDADFMPVMTTAQAKERYRTLVEFVTQMMQSGKDYGVIPGTNAKPTLLKPGAEKLCTLFGLQIEKPEVLERDLDWTGKDHGGEPFFYYCINQSLLRNGAVVASQFASCNSWEKKYRYIKQARVCPVCQQPAIIKGKEEYGGGWICYKKKGGCGVKFRDGDKAIEGQPEGNMPNPNPADLVNTVQKMAQKRALTAAVLLATNASEFFTQDFGEDGLHEEKPSMPAAPPQPDPWPKTLLERLRVRDKAMADAGTSAEGELMTFVQEQAKGLPPLLKDWPEDWKERFHGWVKAFEQAAAERKTATADGEIPDAPLDPASTAGIMEEWRAKLAADPWLQAFNQQWVEIGALEPEPQKHVRAMYQAHAKQVGWTYDPIHKVYVDPRGQS